MNCPTDSYTVDNSVNCLPLPTGIKSYLMISKGSSVVAIVLPIIAMVLILFCTLFIFRKNIDNNKNDFEINCIEKSSVEPSNPIHVTRIASIN